MPGTETWRATLQTWRQILTCSSEPQDRSVSLDNTRSGGIPLSRKLCYAVGGVPYQMTNIAMGFSLQIFLLDVVRMEAFFVSLILFVSRAWDAITDPLVGYLVSRSSQTPVGKLMPWMVLSMPLGVLSYILLWFTPQCAAAVACSIPWYLTVSCLFETFMSCYHVPYTSLNMFLGGSQRERDSATAYRMSVEVLAMLVGSVIQGQVLGVYNAERDQACQQNHELTHSTHSPHATSLQNTRKAFMTAALVLGALYFLCSLVLLLGVKEQQGPPRSAGQTRMSYLSGLRLVVGHGPYLHLVLGFLFASLAFQMSLGNFALFCTHAAGLGAQFQYLILVLLIAATLAVPLWQLVLVRLGKKTTLFIGLPLFIPALIILVTVPTNLPVYMTTCILGGASLATLFLLPWSMLPDVVDDFAMKHPCCTDLEPLFFSCYVFCNKLGSGLSVGFSTMVLYFTGYQAGACSHGDGVVTALRVLVAPVPIILLLVGLVFFYLYPINEAHRQQLRKHLGRATLDAMTTSSSGVEIKLQQSQQPHGSRQKSSVMSSQKTKQSTPNLQHHSPSSNGRYDGSNLSSKSAQFHKTKKHPCVSRLSLNHHSDELRLNSNRYSHSTQLKSNGPYRKSEVTWV